MNPVNKDIVAQIPALLDEAIKLEDTAGVSVLIFRDGKESYFSILGKRDLERDLPMQRDTIVQIASMTKPLTSVAMMMLIEEGKAKLDDPIKKWAPEFSNMKVLTDPAGPIDQVFDSPRDITIEDLLCHRSGIGYGLTSPGPIGKAYDSLLAGTLHSLS